jgi:ABC-type transporter Mla subunit MlaD
MLIAYWKWSDSTLLPVRRGVYMAEELQLGQTVDEIIANLEFMDSLLTQGAKYLQSFGTSIESRQEVLEQSFLLNGCLDKLDQSLQEAEDSFETMRTEATGVLSELQKTLIETHSNLDQASQFIEEAQNEFEAEVAELNTEFEQNFGDIETSLSDMEATMRQIDDSLEDEIEDTRNSFETFSQSLSELDSRAEQFTEIYVSFDSLSNKITSHQSNIESEFGELNQKLEQEDLNEIQGRISTAQDTFTQFLKNFEEDINRNAEEKLRDEITKLISAFEAVCEEEIKSKLEEEFNKKISERTDGLLDELKVAKEISDNARKAAEIAARDDFKHNVDFIQNAVEEMDKCLEAQMHG